MTNLLDETFFLKDAITVAKQLLGKILVRRIDNRDYEYIIVETEAYMGPLDKAAHTYGGKVTERTKPLFDIGGTVYVYLIYGMYNCLNLSANQKNIPECVLIRSVEPLNQEALDFAKKNRNLKSNQIKLLTNGPGKLCMALAIDRTLNGYKVTEDKELFIREGNRVKEIVTAKRVNIDYAKEYKDKLWRFYIKDNPFVSVIDK